MRLRRPSSAPPPRRHRRRRDLAVSGLGLWLLAAAGAPEVAPARTSWLPDALQWLADPDVAFVLLCLAILAIVYEVATAGAGTGGTIGAIMLVTAGVSLSAQPFHMVGLLLVLIALGLFVAEAMMPGVGWFAAAGAVALALAGLLLFPRSAGLGISLGLLLAMAVAAGAGGVAVGTLAGRSRTAPPTIGAAGTVVGAVGVVKDASGTSGQVLVEGARWQAVSHVPLSVGMRVRVVALDGLTMTVEPEGHRVP